MTITFNQVVEFADTGYPGGSQEALDDGISINSPNANMDGLQNTLFADLSDTSQERGVSASINGAQLTIDFNPSAGLEVLDAGDPIIGVTYSGLTNVALRRINAPSSTMTLAALLGVSSITCD